MYVICYYHPLSRTCTYSAKKSQTVALLLISKNTGSRNGMRSGLGLTSPNFKQMQTDLSFNNTHVKLHITIDQSSYPVSNLFF